MLNSTPMAKIFDIIYPVGSIYMSTTLTTKAQVEAILGGTWEKLEGRFLLGSSSSYANGATGGSKDAIVVSHNHTFSGNNVSGSFEIKGAANGLSNLDKTCTASGPFSKKATVNNYPFTGTNSRYDGFDGYNFSMTPSGTISTNGSSGTDKNMPPYLVVNMFKRTALGVKHFLASIFALFSKKFIGGKAIC